MKKRELSGEEHELWSRVTRDVKPAKKRSRAAPKPPAAVHASAARRRASPAATAPTVAPPSKRKAAPVLGGGDPKADRKAAKGLIPIEARIDLHGLTAAAAHTRVIRFILKAREDGLRLVLVITGKGARAGGEGRGVIRREFVEWIEAEPLRSAIARAATARPKDGGAGAFYVFLKRKTRG